SKASGAVRIIAPMLARRGERVRLQIAGDPRPDRLFAGFEGLARDLLVHADVAARQLLDQFLRRRRQYLVLVRVAIVPEPKPQEFLVEVLRLLAFVEAAAIGLALPVARGIRRMDLVDQDQPAIRVGAEFVFGVDQNEAALFRDLGAAAIERD